MSAQQLKGFGIFLPLKIFVQDLLKHRMGRFDSTKKCHGGSQLKIIGAAKDVMSSFPFLIQQQVAQPD